MLDLVIPSPGDRHEVVLKVLGEIRYGPNYNALWIDGVELKGIHVGDNAEWLSANLLALQEWIHVAGREGPDTRVLVIDADKRLLFRGPVIDRGLVADFRLEGEQVAYRIWFNGGPRIEDNHRVLQLPPQAEWLPLE